MSKTEQLNLRISSDLKNQLAKTSEEKGMTMSDFLRESLEDAITGKKHQEHRIKTLEEQLSGNWGKNVKRMLYAAATIANIDTARPLDQCISTSLSTIEAMGLEIEELMQLPRDELEALYLTIQTNIKQNLELSDGAIAFISLLMTTLNGIQYDQHIFDMSPLSIATLKRIRHQLGKD